MAMVAPSSAEAVEAHRAAGQDAVLRRGGEGGAVGDEGGRAGEEAVGVRIVRGPQDLVRADVVGEDVEGALDRLEGDPAVALEQLARTGLEPGVVEALIVEVPVH